jgi:hypothetical protein
LKLLETHCGNINKVLVGNKSDLLETLGSEEATQKYLNDLEPKIK